MDGADRRSEGLRMYDELIAVHTVMRRGADLTVAALWQLASGGRVDVMTVLSTGQWFVEFVNHHHESEDEFVWPVLQGAFPDQALVLDSLSLEHEQLEQGLFSLHQRLRMLEGIGRVSDGSHFDEVVNSALDSAEEVRRRLIEHLRAEEPVLAGMIPQIGAGSIRRMRSLIVGSAPRRTPSLVFGLLEDPMPCIGYEAVSANFQASLRLLKPWLLWLYRRRVHRLGL